MVGPILLVEDNQDHEILTLRALRKHNILNEVVVARDGAEAIEILYNDSNQPDTERLIPQLILLDLKLPKVDGLEVLKRLRSEESTRLLPVVVLTSSDEEQDLLHSYQFGANSYIRKPVDFDDFVEATRQLGLYWLVLNEAPPKSFLQQGNK